MLDRDEALAMGEADVVGGHVVLEVDEGLALRLDLEDRARGRDERGGADRRAPGAGLPLPPAAPRPGRQAVGKRLGGGEAAVEGAGADPVASVGAGGRKACSLSSQTALAPAWLARWMTGDQPPETSRQSTWMLRALAGEPVGRGVERLDLDAGQRLAALGGDDGVAGEELAAERQARRCAPRARGSERTSTSATMSAPASLQRGGGAGRRRHCW